MNNETATGIPFADARGTPDLPQMLEYGRRVTPDQLAAELPSWDADATDLIAIADCFREFCRQKRHANVLYRYALAMLEANPALIADDTNLSGAYYFHGRTLLDLAQENEDLALADQAIRPLTISAIINPRDPTSWYILACANTLTGRLGEGVRCAERALQLECVDQEQEPEFYDQVRRVLGITREEMSRRGPGLGPKPLVFPL